MCFFPYFAVKVLFSQLFSRTSMRLFSFPTPARVPFAVIAIIVAAAALIYACKSSTQVVPTRSSEQVTMEHTDSVTFVDVTAAAGITWKHINGADGRKWFPEENCSGVAFIDYDNDGWEDILLTDFRLARHLRNRSPRWCSITTIATARSPT